LTTHSTTQKKTREAHPLPNPYSQPQSSSNLLAQYAASKGEAYNVEADLPPEALPPQFAFSLPEIARRATHNLRLVDAKKHVPAARQPFRKAA